MFLNLMYLPTERQVRYKTPRPLLKRAKPAVARKMQLLTRFRTVALTRSSLVDFRRLPKLLFSCKVDSLPLFISLRPRRIRRLD